MFGRKPAVDIHRWRNKGTLTDSCCAPGVRHNPSYAAPVIVYKVNFVVAEQFIENLTREYSGRAEKLAGLAYYKRVKPRPV